MTSKRDLAIDRFRGVLIFLMCAGDYMGGVNFVPAFLKHTPDIGFTVADVVAPSFIFAIALTYKPSFEKRFAQSKSGAYKHFLTRYLALVGIGAILTAGGTSVADRPSSWGVLQAIGVAGVICVLVYPFQPIHTHRRGAAHTCGLPVRREHLAFGQRAADRTGRIFRRALLGRDAHDRDGANRFLP